MAAQVARVQVLIASHSPFTKDFRHVSAVIPRAWRKDRTTFYMPRVKDVKPKDRIKYWNIVPGDQVRVMGDAEGLVHEVSGINKYTNRVYLKTQNAQPAEATKQPRIKNVHYSKCQLLVGRFTFPPLPGSTELRNLPVFATRLSTSKPFWLPPQHRYEWGRFAVGTVPRLPAWERGSKERIAIPWPEHTPPMKLKPGLYDTTGDAVAEVTYVPPTLPSDPKVPLPRVPSEKEYIKSLSKRSAFDLATPVELYLQKELSNPHSRAKKQARWQAQKVYKRTLLDEMIKEEYANLAGRSRKDAKAEATWKWKNRLIEERKAEVMRRWVNRGAEARMQNRKARKARKADRMRRKLQNLVLADAPNQVIPGQVA